MATGVRTTADEIVLGWLRRLVAGTMTPSDVATSLFRESANATGEIFSDALHIAAEATTDGDLTLADRLWRELLLSTPDGLVTTTSAAEMRARVTVGGHVQDETLIAQLGVVG
jgi:hypothetical protein